MSNKYITQSRPEQTRVYPTFAGVDFSSDPADVDVHRFAYLKNMWRDYGSEQGGAVETFPGYREVFRGEGTQLVGKLGRVRGMHPFTSADGRTLIAVDYFDKIRVYDPQRTYALKDYSPGMEGGDYGHDWEIPEIKLGTSDSKSVGWHGGIAIVDGKRYRVIRDGAKDINEEYEPYVPITYADGKPYEQRNMLTDRFYHKYSLLTLDSYKVIKEDLTGKRIVKFSEQNGIKDTHTEYSVTLDGDTATITGRNKELTADEVDIPAYIQRGGNLYKVTSIGEKSLGSLNCKEVHIPATVENFTYRSFGGGKFETVTFGVSDQRLYFGMEAFLNCGSLKYVQIPSARAAYLGFAAFSECAFEFVVLPQEVELGLTASDLDWGDWAFPFSGDTSKAKKIYAQASFWDDAESNIVKAAYLDMFAGRIFKYEVAQSTLCFGEDKRRRENDVYPVSEAAHLCGDAQIVDGELVMGPGAATAIVYDGDAGVYKLYERVSNDDFPPSNIVPNAEIDEENVYGFTIYDPAISLDDVTINGGNYKGQAYVEREGDYYSRIYIGTDTPDKIIGLDLLIEGTAQASKFTTIGDHVDAMSGNAFYKGTSKEAIDGCKLCASYDGRIFLSGNPKLPNTVFYTSRDLTGANNPTYFGVLNFFNDGVGNEPITSLLTTSSSLCVLKGDTTAEGSIYYHAGADTGEDIIPRVYPSTQGAAGLGCLGPSCNFLDDPVFISRRGLESIGKEQTNLERSIEHRSYNIDLKLCHEDLKNAKLAEWLGYLVIVCGDRFYLADSRQMFTHRNGEINYEWYYAEGVKGYTMANEHDIFSFNGRRFLKDYYATETQDFLISGIPASELYAQAKDTQIYPIAIAETFEPVNDREVMQCQVWKRYDNSLLGPIEEWIKGVRKDKYIVPCTVQPEMTPTRTFAISAICVVDDELYFGTEGGSVYKFNTDMRDETGRMPEASYNFDGVRCESGCALKSDNCDIPGYTKKTSRGSFVLRTKPFRHSRIKARGRADRGELSVWRELTASTSSELDFSATAFDALSFAGGDAKICIVRENFRRWYEKQLYFYTDGYCEPFGIYSASFRYTVQGKLKI